LCHQVGAQAEISLGDLEEFAMRILSIALIAAAVFACGSAHSVRADTPTKHQLVKDCMAKQQAANSGKPKQDLKDACKDVAKTQKENADAQKKAQPSKP
jgi:hypothetical protein